MFKKVLPFLIFLSSVFGLWAWFSCADLQNKFPPLGETVRLQLENDIHNDAGMPIFWVRFFHNKPVYFSLEIVRRILVFGNINCIFK